MPNRSDSIKNYGNTERYAKLVQQRSKAVIAKLCQDKRAARRRADLYPHERDALEVAAYRTAEAELRAIRAELGDILAEHRSWATQHSDSPPSGEDAQRQMYYSQRATAELAHLSEAERVALVQRVVASGDRERGAEYVAALRGRAPEGVLRALERATESTDAAGARHWGAAVDAIDTALGWYDQHIAKLLDQAGNVTADPERDENGAPMPWPGGVAPEAPINTRILDLWASGLSDHAGAAFQASIAADGQWSDLAAALPYAGTGGYDAGDAGGDHSDQPTEGDPQGQPDAPADATVAQADAQVDAGVQA